MSEEDLKPNQDSDSVEPKPQADADPPKDSTKATATAEWTSEDLINLIHAVKFSNKDASMRAVHTEITTKMSTNESFEFLANVKLNDVKKVWKKAIAGSRTSTAAEDDPNYSIGDKAGKEDSEASNKAADLLSKKSSSKTQIMKFYTVGDGSVQMLAKNYTLAAATEVATVESIKVQEETMEEMKNYVHCFLDVPADKSGTRPHQALVNFNDTNSKKGGADGGKWKKKKGKKGKVAAAAVAKNGDGNANAGTTASTDEREIVKIQMAAPMPGMTEKTVILLYNKDRTARTFIHPDEDDPEHGYDKIRDIIVNRGVKGVLSDGGTKAYFYCRITRRKDGLNIVSVDVVSDLATGQNW